MILMGGFTHFNEQGHARMVDVSLKEQTVRMAVAASSIMVNQQIYAAIQSGQMKKGDVLSVAQVAGIMAAKKTSDVVPMCHPLLLNGVDIAFEWKVDASVQMFELRIFATVKTKGSTGVEMEALTAASVTALTVYDMCKAVDKGMVIGPTYLLSKSGGKNGDYFRKNLQWEYKE